MNFLRKLQPWKTKEQVIEEVNREPTITEAREALKRVDQILWELQQLDRRRKPRPRGSAWSR